MQPDNEEKIGILSYYKSVDDYKKDYEKLVGERDALRKAAAAAQIKANLVEDKYSAYFEDVSPWIREVRAAEKQKVNNCLRSNNEKVIADIPTRYNVKSLEETAKKESYDGYRYEVYDIIPANWVTPGKFALVVTIGKKDDLNSLKAVLSNIPFVFELYAVISESLPADEVCRKISACEYAAHIELHLVKESDLSIQRAYSAFKERLCGKEFLFILDIANKDEDKFKYISDLAHDRLYIRYIVALLQSQTSTALVIPASGASVKYLDEHFVTYPKVNFFFTKADVIKRHFDAKITSQGKQEYNLEIAMTALRNNEHIVIADISKDQFYFDLYGADIDYKRIISKDSVSEDEIVKNLKKVTRYEYLDDRQLESYLKEVIKRYEQDDKALPECIPVSAAEGYNEWRRRVKPTDFELSMQRKTTFRINPKLSIVIPVYRTKETYLRRLIDSIKQQTYTNFEVCFADGSIYDDYEFSEGTPKEILRKASEQDERIKYKILDKNGGISENTNEAIEMATGDYVVFADHDDELTPDALFECVKVINEEPEVLIIYSDEDKIDSTSMKFSSPHFKPDFSPAMIRYANYICHLLVVKRNILEEVAETNGGRKIYERKEYDGAQDYDLILRCCDVALSKERSMLLDANNTELIRKYEKLKSEGRYTSLLIRHIPKVLYHWRIYELSTASDDSDVKSYTVEAGRKALINNLRRMNIPFTSVENSFFRNTYHIKYKHKKPLVSVIIPNKDNADDLEIAIESLIGSGYGNLEIIVVENNSTEESTFEYYRQLEKKYKNVEVLYYEGDFNYARINNYGVSKSSGEMILFLNNDTKQLSEDAIDEMIGQFTCENVGIVGAKLLYSDGTVQHAGVVLGLGGIAGHAFNGFNADSTYFGYANFIKNYSAVTAACMMTTRELFDKVGGFTEELKVSFNDTDFCMKIRSLGKEVVYDPYVVFYHYESKTRGSDEAPEKKKRFDSEVKCFASKWRNILEEGDPYYNRNLTFLYSNFSTKSLGIETIGEPFYTRDGLMKLINDDIGQK